MKYMGSKRSMLRNGLGRLIQSEVENHQRFVDLFCGSASVACFAAEISDIPVLAVDLQVYSKVFAESIISRVDKFDGIEAFDRWLPRILDALAEIPQWGAAQALDEKNINIAAWSTEAKELCRRNSSQDLPIWTAYGGHYFSPSQSLKLDAMLKTIKSSDPLQSSFLASVISAASKCAASPGHTAQPFKANETAGPYLLEAWKRNPFSYACDFLCSTGERTARVAGEAIVSDAVSVASELRDTDLVFIDPPYSGVHYSRFYHVLETVARGTCGEVAGVGRYPPPEERPVSSFSRRGESLGALNDLFGALHGFGGTVIFTFPAGECSNGLSGETVEEVASRYFDVERSSVTTNFSTLGGNNGVRQARKKTEELVLVMR